MNLTFSKMKPLEKQFMFISVAYVWLLCLSFLKFDWENIILQDVAVLKYILNSAISNGRIVNAFRHLLNPTDLAKYMRFLQKLTRSMITTEEEENMVDLKHDGFEVEFQHRTKLNLWKCKETWFDRQRSVGLQTKDDLATQSLLILPTAITQTFPSEHDNLKAKWKKPPEGPTTFDDSEESEYTQYLDSKTQPIR